MPEVQILVTSEGSGPAAVRKVPRNLKLGDLRREVLPDDPQSRAFVPDADKPLADELTLTEAGLGAGAEITVARSKKVTITVQYGGDDREDTWAPNQRLRLVLAWALGKKGFDIPKAEEPNFELATSDTGGVIDLEATVASLVGDAGTAVELDLRRIVAPQGNR